MPASVLTRRQLPLLAATLTLAVLGQRPALAADAAIKINNFAFDPKVLTVPAGTTVTWTNLDGDAHLVSEADGKFRSHALDTGDTFTETFASAGTVDYYCAIHPEMTGRIIVTP